MAIQLSAKTVVEFIGDSITDCGRGNDPEQIGGGYVRMVRDYLWAKDPANAPKVINRGTSGHKVTDLQARWERDVLMLRPDVLSIYIGINDVWHGLNPNGQGVSIEQYTPTYRNLLSQTKQTLPGCKIVLCTPSVIWPPQPAVAEETLKPYIAAVRDLAKEFKVHSVVELSQAFNQAKQQRPDIAWTGDGVHPTSTGHMLIARMWLTATGLL